MPAWAHALPAGRAWASTPQDPHQAVVLEGPWPAPWQVGTESSPSPELGGGWAAGGGQGPVLSGLAGRAAEAGGRGLGYITGLRLPGVGWRRRCSPTWEHLTQPSREAASHASWRLALGTACCRQLCSQPRPPCTAGTRLPWGSTQASPKVRRRRGCGRQLLGGSGDHKGHGRPCRGEGVRGAGPLVRLQGRPLSPLLPPPSLRPLLSARPLRSPVSRVSWSRTVGAPP